MRALRSFKSFPILRKLLHEHVNSEPERILQASDLLISNMQAILKNLSVYKVTVVIYLISTTIASRHHVKEWS